MDKQQKPKSLKAVIQQWTKESLLIRFFVRRIWKLYHQLRYLPFYLFCPVRGDVFLFESFSGRQYSDSPKAIYQQMLEDPSYRDCTFVWAFLAPGRELPTKGRSVRQVRYGSFAYLKYFAQAKYVFTNSRFPLHTLRRKRQTLVQCWHGTPLKRLGCDISLSSGNYPYNTLRQIHELYTTEGRLMDVLVSPSAYTTEKLTSAFNLRKFQKENVVLETGYPRNDFLYQYTPGDVDRIRRSLSVPAGKKLLLYAPTWRDQQHVPGIGYTYCPSIDFSFLREQLGSDYFILFRTHQFIGQTLDLKKYSDFILDVSDYDDVNELYVISDMLITDYSSVFFDYANLRRPILFYMYDMETYMGETRGFYLSQDDLPGPICKDERELSEAIRHLAGGLGEYAETYRRFNERFTPLDDGQAAGRVIDFLKKQSFPPRSGRGEPS